ncbi:hypothetical protein BaRGS_00000600 [Batillaria attramentaria]|uniref:Uncharacterized protein n=1 Tax=Batillaria attramentaria TaxID=370345 RepID=A0ABD0MA90_9CAEN
MAGSQQTYHGNSNPRSEKQRETRSRKQSIFVCKHTPELKLPAVRTKFILQKKRFGQRAELLPWRHVDAYGFTKDRNQSCASSRENKLQQAVKSDITVSNGLGRKVKKCRTRKTPTGSDSSPPESTTWKITKCCHLVGKGKLSFSKFLVSFEWRILK